MELDQQLNNNQTVVVSGTQETATDKVISIKECKQYVGKFDLSDQKVIEMRNTLIGIVDKTINSYLNEFI